MNRVIGIGGIFFKVRDPRQMMAWYEKHLGIAADSQEETSATFVWREADNPECTGLTVWSLFPHDTHYFEPGSSPFMINYRVADLEGLLAQLRFEGVAVDERIEEHEYGRFGWITDPEGNRIELWEPPKEIVGGDKEENA